MIYSKVQGILNIWPL